MQISYLPPLNAFLNTTSLILIITGHHFLKKGKINTHKKFMLSAVVTSSLFLISYLTNHIINGTTYFLETGAIRFIYFTILISHTILAVSLLPLVVITLTFALKKRFKKHQKIARWTYPIWLYVSATGIIIYFMLYQFYAHS